MIVTILAFIIIFSVLILVHEWGHFATARKAGIKVEEFGIGLPPRAKKLFKDKKGTVYSLNWIPFGGYVRMYGEDSADANVLKARNSFASQSIGVRTAVVVAGVVMNFVLAWFLITIGFSFGMKPFLFNQQDFDKGVEQGIVSQGQPVLYVQEVLSGGMAGQAGLKAGDVVTQINDRPVTTLDDFQARIRPESDYRFQLLHEQQEQTLQITTDAQGKMGFHFIISPVYEIQEVRYPWYQAPFYGAREVGRLSFLTVRMFGRVIGSLVSQWRVPDGVAGPVGIARMTHQFTQQGLMALLQFTALLSISLGVINIMPFPALDGGRFLFIIIEVIRGRRANEKWEAVVHSIGFVLLMLLILAITWNDIARLMG